MSNTIINIRFILWYFQVTNEYKVSFKRNWNIKKGTYLTCFLLPISIYAPFTFCPVSMLWDSLAWIRLRMFFQNLNKNKKRLFHFRGNFHDIEYKKTYLRYEFASEFSFQFSLTPDEDGTTFTIGLLFCTLYLTLPIRITKKRMGFYWNNWCRELCVTCGDFYKSFNPRTILFGKNLRVEDAVYDSYESGIQFKFRGKEYNIDKAIINKCRSFYSRIPFSLYHKTYYTTDIKVKNPPPTGGKWGDDGTYGLSSEWEGSLNFSWDNRKEIEKEIVKKYIDCVSKDIRKYGRATTDRELESSVLDWEMVYTKYDNSNGSSENQATVN